MNTTLLDFIRHGTPEGGNRYRGHSIDDPLSAKGWEQMRSAVKDAPVWEQVITSPMRRCQAFAEEYAQQHHLPLLVDERLVEIGFGSWEGKTAEQVLADDPNAIKNFYLDPVNNQPEGAEPLRDFSRRINDVLQDLLAQQVGKHSLVVAHAGVMRAVLCLVTLSPLLSMYRISIGNAAILRVKADGIRPPTVIIR